MEREFMEQKLRYNTKITNRLSNAMEQLGSEFTGFYTKSDFEDILKKLKTIRRAGNRSRIPGTLKMLYWMLEECKVEFEKGREDEYYENIINNLNLIEDDELENKVLVGLYKLYEAYPQPSEYMARIVNRLADNRNQNKSDSLRLRILKQFILCGNYLSDAKYGGRGYIQRYIKAKLNQTSNVDDETVAEKLDDEVFACLEGARRADTKYDGKYGVLKLADDLADGKFRTEGSTKRGLYLFAMAFDMTYYDGDGETLFDSRSDIEKNLFKDYYTNNLMRFLNDAYRDTNAGGLEVDPTGQGINYKNFAELIYVYYISKKMKPQDKIKNATSLIDEILNDEANQRPIVGEARQLFTQQCRQDFIEKLLDMNADELKRYILDNYNFNTCLNTFYIPTVTRRNGDGEEPAEPEPIYSRCSPLSLENEQNTAKQKYNEILELIKNEGVDFSECRYGLCITRVSKFAQNMESLINNSKNDKVAKKKCVTLLI
jgi:hypothetical protein